MFQSRIELRKLVELKNDVEYSGKDHGPYHLPELYNGPKYFKYPVSWRDAKDYLGINDSVTNGWEKLDMVDRNQQVKNIKDKLGDSFKDLGHISKEKYLQSLIGGSVQYQPFGVSLRHSMWEAMSLGVPSLVDPLSYIPKDMIENNLVLLSTGTKEEIMEKISSVKKEEIIEYYEANMTPSKIIENLFNEIKGLI